MDVAQANLLWSSIERRAENAQGRNNLAELVELDDMNPMFDPNSMVVFGRRGAGKTHTLLHLRRKAEGLGDVVVFIDMRKLSSNAGIYNDENMAFGSRATNILVDVVNRVHEELYRLAVLGDSDILSANLHIIGPALDELAGAATEVRVTGETSVQVDRDFEGSDETGHSSQMALSNPPGLTLRRTRKSIQKISQAYSERHSGRPHVYVHLGRLDAAIRNLVECLGGKKLWLLIDEWSGGVPYDLQPVLADMLRRSFISAPGVVVKIGAIEHRSRFLVAADNVEYVGLELGSDTAETLSLDSRLVIRVDPRPSRRFMAQLLTEHFRIACRAANMEYPEDPIAISFESRSFDLLVLASEGNPRDAINLTSKAARKASGRVISTGDVLRASEDYFWNTKYKNIEGTRELEKVFEQFVALSFSRGMRTILFERNDKRRVAVDKLNDHRLIHLIRSGLRSQANGSLYDAYAIDFGSYAEKILRNEMRWGNDGFASPQRFELDDAAEPWRDAVLRRKSGTRETKA